jgi:hypothetical protein
MVVIVINNIRNGGGRITRRSRVSACAAVDFVRRLTCTSAKKYPLAFGGGEWLTAV